MIRATMSWRPLLGMYFQKVYKNHIYTCCPQVKFLFPSCMHAPRMWPIRHRRYNSSLSAVPATPELAVLGLVHTSSSSAYTDPRNQGKLFLTIWNMACWSNSMPMHIRSFKMLMPLAQLIYVGMPGKSKRCQKQYNAVNSIILSSWFSKTPCPGII